MSLEPKVELDKTLEKLAALRDDVRVRVHLAGLEAKEEWQKLEDGMQSVIDRARLEVTETSRTAATEAIRLLETFRAKLPRHN